MQHIKYKFCAIPLYKYQRNFLICQLVFVLAFNLIYRYNSLSKNVVFFKVQIVIFWHFSFLKF